MDRTGHLAIGITALDHQAAEEEGILSLSECLLGRHALVLAEVIEEVGVLLLLGVALGANDLGLLDVLQPELLGLPPDHLRVANQDSPEDLVPQEHIDALKRPLLLALGEDDRHDIFLCLLGNRLQ